LLAEAVVRAADGIPDFSALHSGRYDEHVELYAFDALGSAARISGACRSRCARPTCSAFLLISRSADDLLRG
jgi:hypothetical protein